MSFFIVSALSLIFGTVLGHNIKGFKKEITWEDLINGFCEDIRYGTEGYSWIDPGTLKTPHTGDYLLSTDSDRNKVLKAFHDCFKQREARKFLQEQGL